jgi:CHASE2 domain-containing sensor protein
MPLLTRLLIMPRHRPFLLAGLLIAGLYIGGWLDKSERDLIDLRARLHARAASGELLVVAIDPASLQALNRWPWPRRYHAEVLRRLLAAGARRVAFDLDFSSSFGAEDDRVLEEVLAAAGWRLRCTASGCTTGSSIPHRCPAFGLTSVWRRSRSSPTRKA